MSPLYEYECLNGHRTEELRPMGTSMVQCPACDLPALRVIAAPNIPADGRYSYAPKGKEA